MSARAQLSVYVLRRSSGEPIPALSKLNWNMDMYHALVGLLWHYAIHRYLLSLIANRCGATDPDMNTHSPGPLIHPHPKETQSKIHVPSRPCCGTRDAGSDCGPLLGFQVARLNWGSCYLPGNGLFALMYFWTSWIFTPDFSFLIPGTRGWSARWVPLVRGPIVASSAQVTWMPISLSLRRWAVGGQW